MKCKTVFETFDGHQHQTGSKAAHHLDVMYAELMSKLSSKLLAESNGKHVALQESIDKHLDDFLLKKIKEDMKLEQDEDL